jgi:hypothetical protein
MSVKKVKAFEYTCDGCGAIHVRVQDQELPFGFHGTAVKVDEYGGTNGFDWYACRPSHIQSAVENAIERGMSR